MSNTVYLYAFKNKKNINEEIIDIYLSFVKAGFIVKASLWICEFLQETMHVAVSSHISNEDIIVSIGGDGTMLRAAKIAYSRGNPLLGVNSGKLGFLTEFDLKGIEKYAIKIKNNDYTIETRSLLRVRCAEIDEYALNDVVIYRGGFSKLINVSVYNKNGLITSCVSDGILVATPTGSTGYSLSAGGPIVSPDVECVIITPICAHSLMHRSICVSNNEEIRISLSNTNLKSCQIILDGSIIDNINANDVVYVSQSCKRLKLIRFKDTSFFDKVRSKLSEWK